MYEFFFEVVPRLSISRPQFAFSNVTRETSSNLMAMSRKLCENVLSLVQKCIFSHFPFSNTVFHIQIHCYFTPGKSQKSCTEPSILKRLTVSFTNIFYHNITLGFDLSGSVQGRTASIGTRNKRICIAPRILWPRDETAGKTFFLALSYF